MDYVKQNVNHTKKPAGNRQVRFVYLSGKSIPFHNTIVDDADNRVHAFLQVS